MSKYHFIDGRCKTFERSDDKKILLLPKPYCKMCASPIGSGYERCYGCHNDDTRVDKKSLSKVYAASIYLSNSNGHILSEEIKKCKRNLEYVEGLAEVLEYAVKKMYPELKSYDLMVPTPRGNSKVTENHTKYIVDSLSAHVGIPAKDILYKKDDYSPQLKLGKEDRIENVKDKIGCKEDVDGKVIVVDDVYTTGATMLNSAKALKERGAYKVVGLVLGRAIDIKDLVRFNVLEEIEDG